MEDLQAWIAMVDGWKILTIAVLLLVNLGLGVALGVLGKSEPFTIAKVADFLRNRVLMYVVPYYAVGVLALIDESLGFTVPTAFGILVSFFSAKILTQLSQFGLPIPLPEALKSRLV